MRNSVISDDNCDRHLGINDICTVTLISLNVFSPE